MLFLLIVQTVYKAELVQFLSVYLPQFVSAATCRPACQGQIGVYRHMSHRVLISNEDLLEAA
jgi:hypothetical protein